jgi:hypothetical protein
MCQRAATTHAASILCGSPQLTTGALSPSRSPVHAGCGQQKPLVAPYASPYLVVSKEIKLSPSRWAKGSPMQRPLLAAYFTRSQSLSQSSLGLHEATDCGGGAHVEDRVIVLNLYSLYECLAHYGASEQ